MFSINNSIMIMRHTFVPPEIWALCFFSGLYYNFYYLFYFTFRCLFSYTGSQCEKTVPSTNKAVLPIVFGVISAVILLITGIVLFRFKVMYRRKTLVFTQRTFLELFNNKNDRFFEYTNCISICICVMHYLLI